MQALIAGSTTLEKSIDTEIKSHTVASAPPINFSVPKQNASNENVRRTNSSSETKNRCTISSEKLVQLRRNVEDAIKEHKTFTIKGGWQTIRQQFLRRGWIERFESASPNPKLKPVKEAPSQSLEDVCYNLPVKQDWESQTAYVQKCERTIMSRMLQNHSVDFYWNMRRETNDWHHRVNTHQVMNRFARSLFTSKEGLNLLLQQMHWHCQPGVATVNFPRCYTLGFPDHYNNFIEDFRLTACMSMLKWFVHKYETEDEYAIKSPEGRIPHTALQFALDRCNDFISSQKHLDIDRDFVKVWNHEWDQFISYYYLVVHGHSIFLDTHDWTVTMINAAARTTLQDMAKYWPMMEVDGMRNIWILKPGNKCRGRGIQLVKHLEDVAKIMNAKLKYVVQKYIERPLLIHQTKFDIRQWFMITSVQPLNIWMYRECYLRFSTQIFNLDNFHESLHLTNHAVQCKYANVMQRDKSLPDQNMWDSNNFKIYLERIGHPTKWDEVIYPGMRENIVGAMLACQETMDRRPNTFELYGADFILAEDFKPWLLEINSSPDLSSSTNVTSRLCPQILQDIVKVMVDKRKDPTAETGSFDLVFKQTLPRPPAYLGMSLSVRGRRLFKNKKAKAKDQKEKENKEAQQNGRLITANMMPGDIMPQNIPKVLSPELYKGPVIGDLIEEIHNTLFPTETGFEFVPSGPPPSTAPAKKKHSALKHERVSKIERGSPKSKSNKNNFVNRKSNAKESCKTMDIGYKKPRSMFIKSAYFGLLNEWKLKNKMIVNSDNNKTVGNTKTDSIWDKDTSSILKGKAFLSKFNMKTINDSTVGINKRNLRNPHYCLSSVNLSLSLPQLHKIEPQLTLDFSSNNSPLTNKSDPDEKKSRSARVTQHGNRS